MSKRLHPRITVAHFRSSPRSRTIHVTFICVEATHSVLFTSTRSSTLSVSLETFEFSKYYVVCQISPSCTQPDAAPSSVKHLVFVSMLKHKRVVETEFLSSGSPQGLSSPMLVVIFLSCHCSLLCSPSFLIILSAIYQTMKSERKKK